MDFDVWYMRHIKSGTNDEFNVAKMAWDYQQKIINNLNKRITDYGWHQEHDRQVIQDLQDRTMDNW